MNNNDLSDYIKSEIDRQFVLDSQTDKERHYIGASEIGHKCTRYLWLKFHKYLPVTQFDGRMFRLFYRGKREELTFQHFLELCGFKIIQDCFDQSGFKDGWFAGHGDGIFEKDGIRYLAEYKTHSAKSFTDMASNGVAKSKPMHFAQMHIYMHYFKCPKAIYMAVNKDNDELHVEVIDYDKAIAEKYIARAHAIVAEDKPPARIASTPSNFDCKFCDGRNVCFGMDMPRINCRNCTSINADKKTCERTNAELPESPCEHHSFNPYAMNSLKGWEPVEFYPEHRSIEYRTQDGQSIINGAAPFGIPSVELVKAYAS